MKRNVAVAAVVVVAGVIALAIVKRTPSLHKEEAIRIAVDAYIYGYPLVTFDMARRQQTNVAAPDGEHAPMGQMIKMRSYPAVDNHCCAAPNADTLYTIAWLDVGAEPWVFGIPEMGDRYYIMPMLDGFSEVFHVASASDDGRTAAEVRHHRSGLVRHAPGGRDAGRRPRPRSCGSSGASTAPARPEDYEAVHALQDQFTVVPLSAYGKPYTAARRRRRPGLRHEDRGAQAGQRPRRLHLLRLPGEPAQDEPAEGRRTPRSSRAWRRSGSCPGQDFDGSALGSLDRKADRGRPEARAREDGAAPEAAEDDRTAGSTSPRASATSAPTT